MSTYHRTDTAHVLTKDVVNPFFGFGDKRKNETWYDKKIIPAGTRLIMTRVDAVYEYSLEGVAPGTIFRTELSVDQSRCDSTPSEPYHRETFNLAREVVQKDGTVKTDPAGNYELNMATNSREKKHAQAIIDLQKALIDALSQPIRDFRSVFLQTKTRNGSHSTSDVLHLLYLQGRITLDEIEALLNTVEENVEAELS